MKLFTKLGGLVFVGFGAVFLYFSIPHLSSMLFGGAFIAIGFYFFTLRSSKPRFSAEDEAQEDSLDELHEAFDEVPAYDGPEGKQPYSSSISHTQMNSVR